MNILHSSTDPTLLARLKEMLASSARADIAVGCFFVSGFEQVADDLSGLEKVRILVGRADIAVMLCSDVRHSRGRGNVNLPSRLRGNDEEVDARSLPGGQSGSGNDNGELFDRCLIACA